MMVMYSLLLRLVQFWVSAKERQFRKAESVWQEAEAEVTKLELESKARKTFQPLDVYKIGQAQAVTDNAVAKLTQIELSYRKWVSIAEKLASLKGRHVPSLVGWISASVVWIWIVQNRPEWIPHILTVVNTIPSVLAIVGE